MRRQRQFLFIPLLLILPLLGFLFWLPNVVQSEEVLVDMVTSGSNQRYRENIPIFDVRDFGYQPDQLPLEYQSKMSQDDASPENRQSTIEHGGGSDPNNPYAVIGKTGPLFLQPGATAVYKITLTNYESITHTFQLTDDLSSQLTYVPNLADDLAYNPATRTLTWQGELPPGNLDYIFEKESITLPYLDLADFGAVNLCDDFITNGETCDDVTITFNLGVNGYSTHLYGEVLNQLTVSSNGLILAEKQAINGNNLWLPNAATANYLLAGLWRDGDMGGVDSESNGRWHVAIIRGLVQDADIFYAQWHNVPDANNPDLTVRHAIAVVLNASTASAQALAGHVFFIYDNISDPAQLVDQGYTIGIGDKLGLRGVAYAYAPCCGDAQPLQGYPPTAGTTLHLRPFLFNTGSDYSRTFSYEAIVDGQIPETIVNTAVASSSSANPAFADVWSTHYLYLRQQQYLPFVMGSGEQGVPNE